MVASAADRVIIEPSTGPIHGVQPNANAAPTTNGKKKLFLYFPVSNFKSLLRSSNLSNPNMFKEKIIITKPATILNSLEKKSRIFPIEDAAAPNVINTEEKPAEKRIVFNRTTFL